MRASLLLALYIGCSADERQYTVISDGGDGAPEGDRGAFPDWWKGPCVIGLISDEVDNLNYVEAAIASQAAHNLGYDLHIANAKKHHAENAALLAAYDAVVYYKRNRLISKAEQTALETYLNSGGRLLVTGHDSLGDPDDLRLAEIVRSKRVGDLFGPSSFSITSAEHPIVSGAAGTVSGEGVLMAQTDDHDRAAAAAGSVTVATLESGDAKILATDSIGNGGRVVFWNGNGSETDARSPDWAPEAPAELRTLLANTLLWFCDR